MYACGKTFGVSEGALGVSGEKGKRCPRGRRVLVRGRFFKYSSGCRWEEMARAPSRKTKQTKMAPGPKKKHEARPDTPKASLILILFWGMSGEALGRQRDAKRCTRCTEALYIKIFWRVARAANTQPSASAPATSGSVGATGAGVGTAGGFGHRWRQRQRQRQRQKTLRSGF